MNENKKLDLGLDNLTKYCPDENDVINCNVFTFECNLMVGKFMDNDKLTLDEQKELSEYLNNEWMKEVVEPYAKSLVAFCEKYEIAPIQQKVQSGLISFTGLLLTQMGEQLKQLKDKLF